MACNSHQTGHCRPESENASTPSSMAGRSASVQLATAYSINSSLREKWALYDFFFFLAFEFSAHGDPLRRDAIPVFCHYTNRDYNGKIRNDGRKTKKKKTKKADAQMTEISVSADGDSGETKMTETPYQ